MKNGKWQFVVGTSDFYLSLFICHFGPFTRTKKIRPIRGIRGKSFRRGFFPNGGMISISEIHRKFAWMAREFFFKN